MRIFFLSKCDTYFIMTFSDSTSFVVNSFDDSPSPASTQIDLIRNAFISYALTNLKQNIYNISLWKTKAICKNQKTQQSTTWKKKKWKIKKMHFSEKLLKYFWWTFISLIHLHLHEEIFVGINWFRCTRIIWTKIRKRRQERVPDRNNQRILGSLKIIKNGFHCSGTNHCKVWNI